MEESFSGRVVITRRSLRLLSLVATRLVSRLPFLLPLARNLEMHISATLFYLVKRTGRRFPLDEGQMTANEQFNPRRFTSVPRR